MTGLALRLTVYDIASGGTPISVEPAGVCFVYAAGGELAIDGAECTTRLEPDNGCFLEAPFEATGTGWLYELTDSGRPLLAGAGIETVLSHPVALDFDRPHILRADRVASDPGAETPLHGHRGPGVRRLLTGRVLATIGDVTERIECGSAWFETGRGWVIGRNISAGENVFIRVMVLPAELKGGASSFVPASPEEAKRPRAARYRLFGERDL